MADWSWKQAVAEKILEISNEKNSANFNLDEVYAYYDHFSELFPRNRHIHEKIRQTLQKLRNEDFLHFSGKGNYTVNLNFPEIAGEPILINQRGIENPITKEVKRNIRLRDTFLAANLKKLYKNKCQVCQTKVPLSKNRFYSEAHHLKPIGAPHYGPDVTGNIIVVCPNHHVMFDRGALTIVPDTLVVKHSGITLYNRNNKLFIEKWHKLKKLFIIYHHEKIFGI